MAERIVEFLRKKDLVLIKELGQGACGRTVLLHDPVIDADFVCKKFAPYDELLKDELFHSFVREIKLLHLLNHTNVVRVFNYYLYPERLTGYILMELVDGVDIEEYLKTHPEQTEQVFRQAIDGFTYLEEHGILHRDLRPMNILVSSEGVLKIIDFGFGKKIANADDFDKSISLNWWCEPPDDFDTQIYDFKTEIYFVGKLFEKIIRDQDIEQFPFIATLSLMCKQDPSSRIATFAEVRGQILSGDFGAVPFSEDERYAYRRFADDLVNVISKIEQSTKFHSDADEITRKLEQAFSTVMLEEYIAKSSLIINCFVNGSYYYSSKHKLRVENLKALIKLLRSCNRERKDIVVSNLITRLGGIERYHEEISLDDDIPF